MSDSSSRMLSLPNPLAIMAQVYSGSHSSVTTYKSLKKHACQCQNGYSSFISTRGTGTVSKGTMVSWRAGLQLWHEINYVPWSGCSHLKRVLQGAAAATPSTSCKPKRLLVTTVGTTHFPQLCAACSFNFLKLCFDIYNETM